MKIFNTKNLTITEQETPGGTNPDYAAELTEDDDIMVGEFSYHPGLKEYTFEPAEGVEFRQASLEEILTIFPKLTE